jgi:hypothetical protein
MLLRELLSKYEIDASSVQVPEGGPHDHDLLLATPDMDSYYKAHYSPTELVFIYLTDDAASRRSCAALLDLFERSLGGYDVPTELVEGLKGDLEAMLLRSRTGMT